MYWCNGKYLKTTAFSACLLLGGRIAWAKPLMSGVAASYKHAHSAARDRAKEDTKAKVPETKTAYDFELAGPAGQRIKLADFKGKTLLIVNLASKSSYNSQLPALEKLSQEYQAKGLVVIGIPCNDFGVAEPDPDSALQKLYKTDDKITFAVMAKSTLTGIQELPFFTWLTTSKDAPVGGPVHWNYTKFLVDKNGNVVARFDQDVKPESPELMSTLDEILAGTYKPHAPVEPAEQGAGDDEDDPPQ